MNRVGPLLDELDVELQAFIRLIGYRSDLLFLVRCKRIPGALSMCSLGAEETGSPTKNCSPELFA
jgi:hypothetical protein